MKRPASQLTNSIATKQKIGKYHSHTSCILHTSVDVPITQFFQSSVAPAVKCEWINTQLPTLLHLQVTSKSDTKQQPDSNKHVKIAGFDLDGTLLNPKGDHVFPKDASDWQFTFPNVTSKLRELDAEGYRIVIFTNQLGLKDSVKRETDFKWKMEAVSKRVLLIRSLTLYSIYNVIVEYRI